MTRMKTAVCRLAALALLVPGVMLPVGGSVHAGGSKAHTRKVLLIDIDGVRWDRLRAADTPNIDKLAANGRIGASLLPSIDVAEPVSGPGHASILTGVWPDKHEVVDNTFEDTRLDDYPDVLTRMEKTNPRLSTFSTLDWEPINTYIIDSPDVKLQQSGYGSTEASDRGSAGAAEQAIAGDLDAGFVYFHQVDAAGHAEGSESDEYLSAIEEVDSLVGDVVDAVHSRPSYPAEDWLFLLTTDHGFAGRAHDSDDRRNREIWILASGAGIPASSSWQPRQVDIAPTMLQHMGVAIPRSWGLDGYPMNARW